MELNEDEMALAEKLADAGPTLEEAIQWVKDIVIAAEKRGVRPPVGHSCSCHVRTKGPCDICKVLKCDVFDLNEIAMPPETPGPFTTGPIYAVDKAGLYDLRTNEPIFLDIPKED